MTLIPVPSDPFLLDPAKTDDNNNPQEDDDTAVKQLHPDVPLPLVDLYYDLALPLVDLKPWVSEDTLEWLEDAEGKTKAWKKIEDSVKFFQSLSKATAAEDAERVVLLDPSSSSAEKESETAASVASTTTMGTFTSSITDAPTPTPTKVVMTDHKPTSLVLSSTTTSSRSRLRYWISSTTNPDGLGGIEDGLTAEMVQGVILPLEEDDDGITVEYLVSDSWQGFGNQVWAASRHLANLLADPVRCRPLLNLGHYADDDNVVEELLVGGLDHNNNCHPLSGKSLVELGAGTALPSCVALQCGARVVMTDQAIPDRIRCTAEIAERNWRRATTTNNNNHQSHPIIKRGQVVPFNWGTDVEDVCLALCHSDGDSSDEILTLNPPRRQCFDVLIAGDCCFMPWFHDELVNSVDQLLSDHGVAIFTFPLHGNVNDDQVWALFDQFEERCFAVHKINGGRPVQLTPQFPNDMHSKQALIYTVCLTREPIQ